MERESKTIITIRATSIAGVYTTFSRQSCASFGGRADRFESFDHKLWFRRGG
jgi:hypothetical protein